MKHGLTYKQLYSLHPDTVVLMTKYYMFEAKDNGARVLSYLMGYKLTQDKDGSLSCAGPDKDKILGVLQAHHVNYIVSEFGELTSRASYEDNGFSKYLSLTQNLPVESMVSVTRNDSGPGKALISPGVKPEAEPVPDWLIPGLAVWSKAYGAGTVVAVADGRITVLFPENENKVFVWPDAFDKGFLSTESMK